MIYLKTDEEIELLRENNLLVSKTLAEVGRHIKPGVTTKQGYGPFIVLFV